tara:strand:+ start:241 stop:537 length:297 start_codon:yes stop_codon:yes gene_type:complete
MSNKKSNSSFGKDWTDGQIKFPPHFTPEIIHSALYIWNAGDDHKEGGRRIEYLHNNLGAKKMAFIMSILVLPDLIDMIMDKGITLDTVFKKRDTQTKH